MNKKRNKILFIQHAPLLGGSVVSLKELLLNAKEDFDCIVFCQNQTIERYYQKYGINAQILKTSTFSHNTAYWYKFNILDILRLCKLCITLTLSTIKLINAILLIKPDIIHLNSSTLVPFLWPIKLIFPNVKLIIHIRENIVNGYFGIRKYFIKLLLNFFSDEIIYISEVEFSIMNTKDDKSHVVYNYVNNFDVPQDKYKREDFNLIILGGLFKLKGGDVILEAILNSPSNVSITVLGCFDLTNQDQVNEITSIDGVAYYAKIELLVNELKKQNRIIFGGKVDNPLEWLASSKALIFWALLPHFPRPVFEAWLLHKPVIYFNKGFSSLDINNETVLALHTPNYEEVIYKINALYLSYADYLKKSEKCFKIANLKFTNKNYFKIKALYLDEKN